MSSAELIHLFPSATHPALPVASSILSTLRALTAPGKGNDLRAEERAALVGVSALLACERVQSNDLAQAAVQRASSVAPVHFKSALNHARKLLAASANESPLRSSSHSRSQPSPGSRPRSHSNSSHSSHPSLPSLPSLPSTPSAQRISTMPAPTPPSIKMDPLSPFMTPRKKFVATSSHDLSGLLSPHKHSPVASSPLRPTTTPRKRQVEEDGATPKRARVDEDAVTPKHVRMAEDEHIIGDPQTPSRRSARAAAKMREREGVAAFLAMRPGQSLQVVEEEEEAEQEQQEGARLARRDLEAEIDDVLGRRVRRRLRPRRDWTFREAVWSPNREEMEQMLASVQVKDKGKAKAGDFARQISDMVVT